MCESYKTTRVVADDYADCKVKSLELCERTGKCPQVPQTTCKIVTQNVTKEIPESKVLQFYCCCIGDCIFLKHCSFSAEKLLKPFVVRRIVLSVFCPNCAEMKQKRYIPKNFVVFAAFCNLDPLCEPEPDPWQPP